MCLKAPNKFTLMASEGMFYSTHKFPTCILVTLKITKHGCAVCSAVTCVVSNLSVNLFTCVL